MQQQVVVSFFNEIKVEIIKLFLLEKKYHVVPVDLCEITCKNENIPTAATEILTGCSCTHFQAL